MTNRKILVFVTGGTIGMSPSDSGFGVAPAGNFEQILASITPSEDIIVEAVMWADIPSPHMTPEHMLQLAHDIDEKLKRDDIHGAVILHGTDLLVESSFVVNTCLQSEKPVIATGSMRHLGEAGYDGLRNLQNALIACRDLPCKSELLVCMADWFFSAQDAIKIDSLSVDPFTSQTRGQVGRIRAGELTLYQDVSKKKSKISNAKHIGSKVVLISSYAGMDGLLLNNLLDLGVEGLILEGFGAGNVPPAALEAIENLLKNDIPVVLASRCVRGGVAPIYDYQGGGAHLLRLGCISAGSLSGGKALLLLKIALSNGVAKESLLDLFK